jgi:hypothetical protein
MVPEGFLEAPAGELDGLGDLEPTPGNEGQFGFPE